jgi:hypothetical protein
MAFAIYPLLFTAEVTTPLELEDYSGAALRGTLFTAVWRRFCTNKDAPSCADCPLHSLCPVSALVAPLREENTRGRDIPRPYIILPPLGTARRYEPGTRLIFGITLFGSIIQLLPYLMLSLSELEANGLGRHLPENRGRRGTFRIVRVESYHPLHDERQILYRAGQALVQAPAQAVTAGEIATEAATLSPDALTLDFLTPVRLIDHERLVLRAEFRPLIQRLLERVRALDAAYGEANSTPIAAEDDIDLVAQAANITCQRDETRWEEVRSYSNRQKRAMPISGLRGSATFVGDLSAFRELLVWGQLVHVGKSVVKGNGWYTIRK